MKTKLFNHDTPKTRRFGPLPLRKAPFVAKLSSGEGEVPRWMHLGSSWEKWDFCELFGCDFSGFIGFCDFCEPLGPLGFLVCAFLDHSSYFFGICFFFANPRGDLDLDVTQRHI